MDENEIKALLLEHINRYPEMRIEDMVKLLYQNEFAGGHLISDKGKSLDRLESECEALIDTPGTRGEEAFEDIGNGLCRMNLRALASLGITLATANGFFTAAANSHRGSVERFEKKLGVLLSCCGSGQLPFLREQAESYISSLKQRGYPPVSHSEAYRAAYAPAYRVVKSACRDYIHVFRSIDALLDKQHTVSVAIDGNCGAGKSALASLISEIYDCNVFHMDDFFLRPEQRNPERLNETGGNIDYERFEEEVLERLKSGLGFSYRKYDCSHQAMGETVRVLPKKLNIIEGSYSMHPKLINAYDLKIFLQVSGQEQRERILKRSGEAMLKRFVNEWIPLEDAYFAAFGIKEASDIVYGSR